MTKQQKFQLGFSLLLLTILAITASTALADQRRPSFDGWCPSATCPLDLSGYVELDQCQNKKKTCEAWQNTTTRAYCSRNCNPF